MRETIFFSGTKPKRETSFSQTGLLHPFYFRTADANPLSLFFRTAWIASPNVTPISAVTVFTAVVLLLLAIDFQQLDSFPNTVTPLSQATQNDSENGNGENGNKSAITPTENTHSEPVENTHSEPANSTPSEPKIDNSANYYAFGDSVALTRINTIKKRVRTSNTGCKEHCISHFPMIAPHYRQHSRTLNE